MIQLRLRYTLIAVLTLVFTGCAQLPGSAYDLFASHQGSIWEVVRLGMRLPDASDVPQVRAQITWYQQHKKSLVQDMEHATPYLYFVLSKTTEAGLPSELALIPFVESGYNPFAYSWVGATGLWQMMPGTASGLGLPINWWYDGRRDVVLSTQAALDYLTYLHELFQGDWLLAIAAYDTGEGRVQRSIDKQKNPGHDVDFWSLDLPKETRHYLPKVLALQAIIRNPEAYGFELPNIPNVPYVAPVTLPEQISLEHIAKLAGVDIQVIRSLNPGYRRWSTEPNIRRTMLIPAKHLERFKKRLAHDHPPVHHNHYHAYTVRAGDTLGAIAKRFRTQTKAIVNVNHLTNKTIRIDQKLLIPTQLHTYFSKKLDPKQRRLIAADHLPGPKQVIHTVKRGQKLVEIAKRYRVKASQMRFWNQLKTHVLKPGQQLVIWQPKKKRGTRTLTVQPGQSLSTLAWKHRITVADLKRWNHLSSDRIRAGQRLMIH